MSKCLGRINYGVGWLNFRTQNPKSTRVVSLVFCVFLTKVVCISQQLHKCYIAWLDSDLWLRLLELVFCALATHVHCKYCIRKLECNSHKNNYRLLHNQKSVSILYEASLIIPSEIYVLNKNRISSRIISPFVFRFKILIAIIVDHNVSFFKKQEKWGSLE